MIDPKYEQTWRDLDEQRFLDKWKKRILLTLISGALTAGVMAYGYSGKQEAKATKTPTKTEQPAEKITLDGLLSGAPTEVIHKVYHFKDANDESIRIDNYVRRHPDWFERLVNLGNRASGLEGEYRMSQQDLAAALGAESRLRGRNKGQLTKPAYDEIVRMIPQTITEKKKKKIIVKKNHRHNAYIAELFGNRIPTPHEAFNDERTNLYVCGAYLISLVPRYTSTGDNPHKLDPRKCAIWEYNWGNDIRDIVKNGKNAADIYIEVARLKRDGVATAFLEGIRYDAIRKNGQEAIQQRTDSLASGHSSQTGASAQTQHR